MVISGTSSTNILNTYDYDGYGNVLATTASTANNYRYAGQQWDPDLGMYYLRARYYKPSLGRFWTGDSYEGDQSDPLSLHKYLYCQANPINMIDPTGCLGLFNYTDQFGYKAHAAIESAYQAEHPGAIVGTKVGLLGTPFKPDILDGVNRTFMEIKPLSLSGIAKGIAQIATYDVAFSFSGKGYSRGTWPSKVRGANVGMDQIAYFNVQGVIFYTDATDNLDDIASIATFALARQFVVQNSAQLIRTFSGIMVRIPGIAVGGAATDNARLYGMTGIVALIGLMGAY
jgi:RHS repeat-associated protein